MVIMHEMAHMWFGDLVTMRWWDDLWLNESFANWAGYGVAASATRFTQAWTTFALAQKAWAYVQDQLPSTHPVVADIPELEGLSQQFDGITYAKGASVLKQLVAYVGYDAFLAGVNRYFERHAWGNATLADLLVELEEASGRDLGDWARVWLQEPGVTTLQAHVELDAPGPLRTRADRAAARHPARGRVPGAAPAPRRDRRLPMGRARGARAASCVMPGSRWTCPARLRRSPSWSAFPAADLLLVNDDDLTYAKVRLDPASMATARAGVGDLAESLPAGAGLGRAVGAGARPRDAGAGVRRGRTGRARPTRTGPAIIDTVRGLMRPGQHPVRGP